MSMIDAFNGERACEGGPDGDAINVVVTDGGIENFHNGGHPNKRGHELFLAQFESWFSDRELQLSDLASTPNPAAELDRAPTVADSALLSQNVDDWVTPVSDLRALDYRLKPINNNQILWADDVVSAEAFIASEPTLIGEVPIVDGMSGVADLEIPVGLEPGLHTLFVVG